MVHGTKVRKEKGGWDLNSCFWTKKRGDNSPLLSSINQITY
jgi:hypothetical protein